MPDIDPPTPTVSDPPVSDPPVPDPPVSDPPAGDPPKGDDANSAIRQMREHQRKLEEELKAYKRREEEQRKAKLSEEERRKEEFEAMRAENERLKAEQLQAKIAAEFNLPPKLAGRLVGTDEAALRADAEDLATLLPPKKVSQPNHPTKEQQSAKRYSRAELAKDPKLAASAEVRQAAREGRIDP